MPSTTKGGFVAAALMLLLMPVLPGCIVVVDDNDRGRHGLHGTGWYLEVIVRSGRSYRANQRSYTMSFLSDEHIGGKADCNAYNGKYDTNDDGAFTIREVSSTLALCDDESEVEPLFWEGIQEAASYEIRGGDLYLYTHDDAFTLQFKEN